MACAGGTRSGHAKAGPEAVLAIARGCAGSGGGKSLRRRPPPMVAAQSLTMASSAVACARVRAHSATPWRRRLADPVRRDVRCSPRPSPGNSRACPSRRCRARAPRPRRHGRVETQCPPSRGGRTGATPTRGCRCLASVPQHPQSLSESDLQKISHVNLPLIFKSVEPMIPTVRQGKPGKGGCLVEGRNPTSSPAGESPVR